MKENEKYRNSIGIIDFSNAKFIHKNNGQINFTEKNYLLRGNKTFASNNALEENDILFYDDIESLFYILIYFHNNNLPWMRAKNSSNKLTKEEILEIRKKIPTFELCKNFPESFSLLFEKIMKRKISDKPDYTLILQVFESIKKDLLIKLTNNFDKFCWLSIFKEMANGGKIKNNAQKSKEIHQLFEKYCIKIDKYIQYIFDK